MQIEEGGITVWRFPLAPGGSMLDRFMGVLSVSEKERAARFHSPRGAERFVAAHGSLRYILAGITGVEPESLWFRNSEFGKPSMATPGETGCVRFNMAHSGEAAVVAVSREREVGIDSEVRTPMKDLVQLAERCFSPPEMELIRSCDGPRRTDTFFRIWTRKEAYIKARGEGMSLDLREIDVTTPAGVLDGRWHVRDLGMYGGCTCALAADGPIGHVRLIDGPILKTGNPYIICSTQMRES